MAEVEDEPKRPAPLLSAPVPLTSEHDLSGFDCGEPALNDWLRHRALKNESRFSRTYVVCEGNLVVAYFCILAGAVERAADSSCPPPSGSSALCLVRGSRGSSTSPSPSFSA